MGCQDSKGARKTPVPKLAVKKGDTRRKREDLNPADFVISKRTGEVIIKEEGSIMGEQFNLEECKDCDIFLFDHIATAFIDECERCRIFVGPVETSLFVRNCKSCDTIMACQQFRARDCTDCKFALFSTTEPIIETSKNMQFACFDFSYFSLRAQFASAGLKLWNNKWWMVYDFNKNAEKPNWSLLPQEEVPHLLRTNACANSIAPDELLIGSVVPLTLGSRPRPSQSSCFVLFLPDSDALIEAFLTKTAKMDTWTLCRTRGTMLGQDQLKTLLAWTKESRLPKQCTGREVTGVEVCGEGVHKQVQEVISTTGFAIGSKNIRVIPEQETQTLSRFFFEVWKDEI